MSWHYEGKRPTRDGNNSKKTEEKKMMMQLFDTCGASGQNTVLNKKSEDSTKNKVNEQPHINLNVECPYGPIGPPRPKVNAVALRKEDKDSSGKNSNL